MDCAPPKRLTARDTPIPFHIADLWAAHRPRPGPAPQPSSSASTTVPSSRLWSPSRPSPIASDFHGVAGARSSNGWFVDCTVTRGDQLLEVQTAKAVLTDQVAGRWRSSPNGPWNAGADHPSVSFGFLRVDRAPADETPTAEAPTSPPPLALGAAGASIAESPCGCRRRSIASAAEFNPLPATSVVLASCHGVCAAASSSPGLTAADLAGVTPYRPRLRASHRPTTSRPFRPRVGRRERLRRCRRPASGHPPIIGAGRRPATL